MKRLTYFITLLFLSLCVSAQTWTTHFAYNSVDQVAEGKGRYTKLSTAMSYQFSADGQNWETLGSDRRKTGLTAATTYYIRGLYRGCVPGLSCQVKTYPETPLTNGSLEDYTIAYGKDGNISNYNHYRMHIY